MIKKIVSLFVVILTFTTNVMPAARSDYAEETPLHKAARAGDVARIKKLLANYANINARDLGGWTPLLSAACHGREECVQELLNNGADVTAQSWDGWTALMCAASGGYVECTKKLLQRDAHLEAKDAYSHRTSLHYAADKGYIQCVEILAQHGADLTAETVLGQTAKDLARNNDHNDIVALLERYENILEIKEPDID